MIHLDIDPAEIGKLRHADVALVGDLSASLDALQMPTDDRGLAAALPRAQGAARLALRRAGRRHLRPGTAAPPVGQARTANLTLTCDVGQHQMWVAQHCLIRSPERHLSSGGLRRDGLWTAGGHRCVPCRPVASRDRRVSGDGSIMINIQELATLKRYGLPVKILLIDNQALGMVRQWQELFFERRFSEVDLSDNPDFVQVARSFGIDALCIESRDQIGEAIDALLNHPGALLVHCRIDPAANVWPLVPPGHTNATMLEGATP